jgi:xanthine dehydrogenase accessory factor
MLARAAEEPRTVDDPGALDAFIAAVPGGPDAVVRVRVARAQGCAPREAGAEMLVAAEGVLGTIGGGQLEYMAIDEARALLARGGAEAAMDVPLGPEIGQCCGGRVALALARLDAAGAAALRAAVARRRAALPAVLVLGAGHVGLALARALAALPVRTLLVDGRADALAGAPAGVEARQAAIPEAEVRGAPPGSAFVILTHDHALDFLLAAEALGRGDAAYVGMIGSATKRAAFAGWCRRQGLPAPEGLICPIGAGGSADKRPAVIAAFVAAEVIAVLTGPRAVAAAGTAR